MSHHHGPCVPASAPVTIEQAKATPLPVMMAGTASMLASLANLPIGPKAQQQLARLAAQRLLAFAEERYEDAIRFQIEGDALIDTIDFAQ